MNCPKCGNPIEADARFCKHCGFTILKQNDVNNKTPKKRSFLGAIIIIIVCIGASFGVGFVMSKVIFSNQNKTEDKNTTNTNLNTLDNTNTNVNTNTNINTNTNTNTSNNRYSYRNLDISKINIVAESNDDLTSNIEIKDIFFKPSFGEINVYAVNNNNKPVEVTYYLEFFDSEGYRIDRTLGYNDIFGNNEFVIGVKVINDGHNYETVKLTYKAKEIKSYYTFPQKSKLKLTTELGEFDNISVTLKNNSNVHIKTSHIACIYYKDGKVVFADHSYIGEVKPGKTGEGTCYHTVLNKSLDYIEDPVNNRPEYIEYDDYKVVIQSAYHYDSVNY